MLAPSAPVLWDPLVGNVPLQPPEAAQDVAFVELHINTELPPLLTLACDAVTEAVAGGLGVELSPPQAANHSNAPKPTLRDK